jgi:hypothetical protein
MEEKVKYISLGFGIGIFLCALVLGLLGKNRNIQEIAVPLIGTIKFVSREVVQPDSPVRQSLEGVVSDIFGNPRKDVVVLLKGEQIYSVTDQAGRFLLPEIPSQPLLDLEARFGAERAVESIAVGRDTGEAVGRVDTDPSVKIVRLRKPLVLQNPEIRVEALLCESITDHTPIGIFEGENPGVPADLDVIWCFIRVFGPLGYEHGRSTQLICDWFYNGEHVYRHTIDVGFNPASQGWRTHVYKSLNRQRGPWRVEIRSLFKTLAALHFELS